MSGEPAADRRGAEDDGGAFGEHHRDQPPGQGSARLEEWFPVAVRPDGLLLRHTGPLPFPEAFVDETIAGAPTDAALVRFDDLGAVLAPPSPMGLMVHTGRCGSTLLCRLLDASAAVATIREPAIVWQAAESGDRAPTAVAAVMGYFVSMGAAVDRRVVVKLSSIESELLARLAPPPTARLIGVVRNPVEVIGRLRVGAPKWLVDLICRHEAMAEADLASHRDADGAIPSALVEPHLAELCRLWNVTADVVLASGDAACTVGFRRLLDAPVDTVDLVLRHLGVRRTAADDAFAPILGRHAKTGAPIGSTGAASGLPASMSDAVREATRARRLELVESVPQLAAELIESVEGG